MSLYGAFDEAKHFDELNTPLATAEGVIAPSARRARAIDNLFGGVSDPGVVFPASLEVTTDLVVGDDADITGDATVGGTLGVTGLVTGTGGFIQAAGFVAPITPVVVQQAINANGAIALTSFYTAVSSVATTGQTFTLADSARLGQLKKIQLIDDNGDATVTFNTNATIVFADVGDYAVLIWDGADWIPIELGNDADGVTAPAYTPAS